MASCCAWRLRACTATTADTLAQGDVVNEAMLRLMESPGAYNDRAHFFATVSLTMRSVLREHARARLADKRGGDRVQLTLTLNSAVAEESMAADLLTLDRLLDTLAAQRPARPQVMELTYFIGLPRQTSPNCWRLGAHGGPRAAFRRAWLAEQLGRGLEA
jgi:RNA polymerase sigma factor (TIGR02999 family)